MWPALCLCTGQFLHISQESRVSLQRNKGNKRAVLTERREDEQTRAGKEKKIRKGVLAKAE